MSPKREIERESERVRVELSVHTLFLVLAAKSS